MSQLFGTTKSQRQGRNYYRSVNKLIYRQGRRVGSYAVTQRRGATNRWKRSGARARIAAAFGVPRIGFPDNTVVKMRYHTSLILNPTNSGAAVSYVFRANSIFDPDFTSAGHQPLGHDQWSVFYSTYTVLGSKCMIKCSKDETINTISNYLFGILLNDTSSLPTTNVDTLIEQGLSTPSRMGVGVQSAGCVLNVTKAFSAKKFFNVANIKDNQDRIGAPFGSNPPSTGDAFFIPYAAVAVGGGNATNSIDVDITIDFIVLLSDPIALPGS